MNNRESIDYKSYYNKVSCEIFEWSLNEKDRVKSSKLARIADIYEYKFRVKNQIYDGRPWNRGNRVTLPTGKQILLIKHKIGK